MNKEEQLENKIESLRFETRQCGGTVWDCESAEFVIIEPNYYRPGELGKEKATPFCQKCGRCGVMAKPEDCEEKSKSKRKKIIITRGEADAKKESCKIKKEHTKKQIDILYTELNELQIKNRKESDELWWETYSEYLKSPKWGRKRALVIDRDMTCQACLVAPAEQVHHLTYAHVFNEPLFELVGICKRCHDKITEMDREKRKS